MGRPKTEPVRPEWFKLSLYDSARDLDATDWYVNLVLRRSLWHPKNAEPWASPLCHFLRMHRPVLSVLDSEGLSRFLDEVMDAAEVDRLELPSSVVRALKGQVTHAIEPLNTQGLYVIEKRLPPEVRSAVKDSMWHPGLSLTIDEQFGHQLAGKFLQVSVNAPDQVLIDEFRDWLRLQRQQIKQTLGDAVAPFQKTHAALVGKHRPNTKTFAKSQLLAYLDIDQWRSEANRVITVEGWAQLLEIDESMVRDQTKRLAALLMRHWALESWLRPLLRAR